MDIAVPFSFKRRAALDKYVDVVYEMVHNIAQGNSPYAVAHKEVFERVLSQTLYDAPQIFSGLASVRLIERKLNNVNTKHSVEHFNSRQQGGQELMQYALNQLHQKQPANKNHVRAVMIKYCSVHYTTPEENKQLVEHQRVCSGAAAYKRAGIVLMYAHDLFAKTTKARKQAAREELTEALIEHYNPGVIDRDLPDLQEQTLIR